MQRRFAPLFVALFSISSLFLGGASFGDRSVAQEPGPLAGELVDIALDVGVAEVTRTWSADVWDHDDDGDEDWLFIRHNPQNAVNGIPLPNPSLYGANGDGTYTDVNDGFLGGRDRHMCTWGDVDLNGRDDLFCAIGLTSTSRNELRLQNANGTFTGDKAPQFGLTQNSFGRYRTATFLHANGDMYPDIYVTRYYGSNNSPDDPSAPDPYPNELWLNTGGTGFVRDASYKLDVKIGAPKEVKSCAQAIDYDKDLDEDLMVCGRSKMFIYRNDLDTAAGTHGFTNVSTTLKASGTWRDAEFADFNHDGRGDLARVKPGAIEVKLWTGNSFSQQTYFKSLSDSPSGQDLTTGDFNGDGHRDVYIVRNCPRIRELTDDPDVLLLGDGLGGFTEKTILAIPRRKGCGNTVSAIKNDADPAEELIVLNGHKLRAGPTQFFDWQLTPLPAP